MKEVGLSYWGVNWVFNTQNFYFMRYLLTITNLILCFGCLIGQNETFIPAYCGPIQNKSIEQRQHEAAAFLKWKLKQQQKSAPPLRTVPVVVHLLEYDPSITNEQVESTMAALNNIFNHSNNVPNPNGGAQGADTRIQFCLAQRAPDGGLTKGIVRWRSDYEAMDVDLEDAKLKTQGQWDPRYYLNIWVLKKLDTETDQSYTGRTWWNRSNNLGGYSGGPGGIVGPDARTDGVIVAGLGPALWAHEIGHYLDLAHTFSETCKNNDCLVDGDGICDTPPDVSQSGCNQNSCDTDTLSNYSNGFFRTDVLDMTSNIMDYSSCPSEFTQGQADKMLFILDNNRINLAMEPPSDNDACTAPCEENFNIEFSVSERYPEPGIPVEFTSSLEGDSIDSYEWYVERQGHPGFDYTVAWLKGYTPTTAAVAQTPDLQYTFSDPGKYHVYLKTWNSNNPGCFASYARTLRVTCLGIDARFTPSARFIAAKQPKGKLVDAVTFRNRSVNATGFEWFVTHEPYDSMAPAQPDFYSTDQELVHTFLEPGDYYITMIASNGTACFDTCGPFKLPVADPTIDGRINIRQVDCYYEDSLRISFRMFNDGYDTIRIGTPITFYDEDPTNVNPVPKALGTYYLDRLIYGKDAHEDFVVVLPVTKAKLDQLWAVFNDLGSTAFPIEWPKPDLNVMSIKSEFPPSGHNELAYDNNYGDKFDFQFSIDLGLQRDMTCLDDEIQLEASYRKTERLNGIEWIPNTNLSCNDCLDPVLQLPDEDFTQTVILTSEYYCKDTVDLLLPRIREDVPPPNTTRVPDHCLGGNSLHLSNFVTGDNLTWYPSNDSNQGTNSAPISTTDEPGTHRFWVSQTINGCEGPRAEVSYSVQDNLAPPIVKELPNICVGESAPNLATAVSGNNLVWYNHSEDGTGTTQVPSINTDTPGTFSFWVSRQNGNCESSRVGISLTVVGAMPPRVPDSTKWCWGATPPDLANFIPGSELRWYSSETVGNGTSMAPFVNTQRSGTYAYWVSQISNNCESSRAKVSFTVAPKIPEPTINDQIELCEGSSPLPISSLAQGNSLLWYSSPDDQTGNTSPPTIETKNVGVFSYWVTQTQDDCESEPVEVTYTVHPTPETPGLIDLPDLCKGAIAPDLDAFVLGENKTWYSTPTTDVGSSTSPLISMDSAYTIFYYVSQTVNNCEGPRVPLEILVSDINIEPGGPYQIIEGNTGEIDATAQVFPSDGNYFTRWLDPSGITIATNQLSTTIAPTEPSFYTIEAEVNGCRTEKQVFVDLIFQLDPSKTFSPNGDGRNDYWYIGDIDKYPESTLTIFNRWGSQVYQVQGYQNDWAGTWKGGTPLPVATYYYVIDLNKAGAKAVTGSVTLVR